MDISIEENPRLHDIAIAIACPRIDDRVNRIAATLNAFNERITGVAQGNTFIIGVQDIFYFESVDRKTFLYTEAEVFETPLKLYEVKDRLSNSEFIQISKQMIINFEKVTAVKPDFNARLQIGLANGEKVMVSRQYAPDIKRKLGIIR